MGSNVETCEYSQKNTTVGRKSYQRSYFLTSVAIYVLLTVAVSFVTVVDGRIAPRSGRRIEIVDAASDVEVREEATADAGSFGVASVGGVRRRPRRSAREQDFIAFRKFLHAMRSSRLGASIDISPEDIVKRDAAVTMMERGSTGNMIASKVKCGECKLTKQWIPVSKPGCRTNFVLAPTCMGMCETWEIPDIHPPFITTHHRVCRPTKIAYRQIRLRKCNPGVNNVYVMPIAQNCACMKCKSKNTACRPLL